MTAEQKIALYNIASFYGCRSQEEKAVEELAELIQAIQKKREKGLNRSTKKSLIDELADVSIMVEQLKYLYKCEGKVKKRIKYKIKRQKKRMKKAEPVGYLIPVKSMK